MRKKLIFISLSLFIALQILACRFTVREIGFSTLSRDVYSLVIVDANINPDDPSINKIRTLLHNSNIGLTILAPYDNSHPAFVAAQRADLSLPATFLMAPDDRVLSFGQQDINEVVDQVLNSVLRARLMDNFYNSFAFLVMIESSDQAKNIEASNILQSSCDDITNRMPNMPKQVKNGPGLIKISNTDFDEERILLWSLGIDQIPDSPLAIIIYGRGRIIGNILDYKDITDGLAFKRMAMIGADCECGLDREWMLGDQIPMNWPKNHRQQLTERIHGYRN